MTADTPGVKISGLKPSTSLRDRIEQRMRMALAAIAGRPACGEITFFDDNGPKGGGVRCAFTVRLPYRPVLRVEHTATTPRLAFDGGFATLDRLLERYRERDRDNRRHPKKYFAARQVTGGPPSTARATRRARTATRG